MQAFGGGPVVELHHARIHLEPVGDLVLGREHRPVIGKREVRQVVVPDRVVQAERLVALPPGVAGARVLLDDQRRDAEALQPRAERDAALAAADDEDVGLARSAELGGFLLSAFRPARLDAVCAPGAGGFLVSLQLAQRGEQRPGAAFAQAHMADATAGASRKAEEEAVAGGRWAGERPRRRRGSGQSALEARADRGPASAVSI